MLPVPHPRVQFGSSQKRKLVPLHFAPDRPDAPGVRPYPEDRRPIRVPPQGKPFNSATPRFMSSTVEPSPGPGFYDQDAARNRKVSWPMCFGRPDGSRIPQPEEKSLSGTLESEREFIKHRSRVAYLSLYYELLS
ncbi:protein pitchfork-like [Pseudoliparis swirei]|uniref:protein pitchfork-like n=1 Tax=Pseudoliparis swirei TaxID=2059687 RepID=UPI0024BE6F94|nr:protein pitchfork-like [Pseudoliparis swirei]